MKDTIKSRKGYEIVFHGKHPVVLEGEEIILRPYIADWQTFEEHKNYNSTFQLMEIFTDINGIQWVYWTIRNVDGVYYEDKITKARTIL